MIPLAVEYEPIQTWHPSGMTMREVCQRLSHDTRTMKPFEKALFIQSNSGIRPHLVYDGHGVGLAVPSLTHYPHEHILRPIAGGYHCPCEAKKPGCWHAELCQLQQAEHGEDPDIAAARAAA